MRLRVQNITKKFGQHQVLKGINLTIDEPGIRVLIGPNGSGKSTLFQIIGHLLPADTGTVEVVDLPNDRPQIFKKFSMMIDGRILYPELSEYDHLKLIESVQKIDPKHTEEVIDIMEISSFMKQPVGSYSLGMRQNLLLAMSILNDPTLLILDEPLNGLDPTSIVKIRLLLKRLAVRGTSILFSSHTLSEVDQLTDHIYFLKDGKIIEEHAHASSESRYLELYPEEHKKIVGYQQRLLEKL